MNEGFYLFELRRAESLIIIIIIIIIIFLFIYTLWS